MDVTARRYHTAVPAWPPADDGLYRSPTNIYPLTRAATAGALVRVVQPVGTRYIGVNKIVWLRHMT